jgi:hypothetical protein
MTSRESNQREIETIEEALKQAHRGERPTKCGGLTLDSVAKRMQDLRTIERAYEREDNIQNPKKPA